MAEWFSYPDNRPRIRRWYWFCVSGIPAKITFGAMVAEGCIVDYAGNEVRISHFRDMAFPEWPEDVLAMHALRLSEGESGDRFSTMKEKEEE